MTIELDPQEATDRLAVASMAEAFQNTAAAHPDAVALRTPGGAQEITFAEYADRVRSIAAGLVAIGLQRGDSVALMMVNRPEFNLCDCAAVHLGAPSFSVYNTSSPDQIRYLLENAGTKAVFCQEQFAPAVLAASEGTAVETVICIDAAPEGTIGLDELEAAGASDFDFEATWRAVGEEDLLTLIYTSGTTGPPKGVEITHANMLAQLRCTSAVLPVTPGDREPSYLPSAHIADRWGTHYTQMAFGLQITCVADPRAIAAALPDVKPTVWGAVPRIWEKIKAALEAGIEAETDATRKGAMQWAIATGIKKVKAEQAEINGQGPGPDDELLAEFAKADELVLSKLRAKIGLDEVRWSVSGAAPVAVEVLEFFGGIGLPVSELWGMSELSCCATVNPPQRSKIGTVGPALPGIEVKLADDGELLCRGPIVMRGYRNQPEKTAEAIDSEGWMHTGDIAEIDDEGYVKIVDRKKELIINAAGKNMSPANIEARIKSSSQLIGQAVAIGDRRPYNVALIVLDPDTAAGRGPDDPEVQAEVERGVAAANEQLSRVEQVKKYKILPTDWEPGGDELTPTMKLKRKPIGEKYAAEIEALYAD